MKHFSIAVLAFTIAGCAGNTNASTQAGPTPGVVIAPIDNAPATNLPVYPGATESKLLGTMTVKRCGHNVAVTNYTVNAEVATVARWYAAKMPGAIRLGSGGSGASALITNVEFFEPNGAEGAGITQPAPNTPGQPAGYTPPVSIGLAKYSPPLDAGELKTMQGLLSSDPAARKAATAKMKARCPDQTGM